MQIRTFNDPLNIPGTRRIQEADTWLHSVTQDRNLEIILDTFLSFIPYNQVMPKSCWLDPLYICSSDSLYMSTVTVTIWVLTSTLIVSIPIQLIFQTKLKTKLSEVQICFFQQWAVFRKLTNNIFTLMVTYMYIFDNGYWFFTYRDNIKCSFDINILGYNSKFI